jgi:hypothetical protein
MPYPVDLKSKRWKAFSATQKKARFRRCAVCGWDYLKCGGWLEEHHLTYDRANKERKSDTISLCGNRNPFKRHHKKGKLTLEMIRRDRQIYLTMKWTGIIILLPFRLLILLFLTSRRLWKKGRSKERAT